MGREGGAGVRWCKWVDEVIDPAVFSAAVEGLSKRLSWRVRRVVEAARTEPDRETSLLIP